MQDNLLNPDFRPQQQAQPQPQLESLDQISVSQDASLTQWQLTADEVIGKIEENLRGKKLVKKQDGTKFYEKFAEPIMSEEGIREVIREIRIRIHKIAFLTNLEEGHINEMTGIMQENIASKFFDNAEVWGLAPEDQEAIIDSIGDVIFLGLRKSLNDGERKTLRMMERRLERVQPNDNKGQGMMGMFR